MTLAGPLNWSDGVIGGAVQCNGGIVSGGSLVGGNFAVGGALINNGTLAWTGNITSGNGSQLVNNGTINLAAGIGTQPFDGGNYGYTGPGAIVNAGTFTVSGPGTSSFRDAFNNSGTLSIPSGSLHLTGGVSLAGGTLSFGISSASSFGTLSLTGGVALAGTLRATFNGYTPNIGDSFALVSYGSETGTFTALSLPPTTEWRVEWQVYYGNTAFILSVAPYVALEVNRNTIMNLGVRVGDACVKIHDEKMRTLPCSLIEVDEIWGFVNKKAKNVTPADRNTGAGDVWTFIAVDPVTKIVASYLTGKRDAYHTDAFMADLASRLSRRPQISSDALAAYPDAVDGAFGSEVDYGQVVKTYSVSHLGNFKEAASRYSPAEVVLVEKTVIAGHPDRCLITTSHVEKQNHTLRMHCRRLVMS